MAVGIQPVVINKWKWSIYSHKLSADGFDFRRLEETPNAWRIVIAVENHNRHLKLAEVCDNAAKCCAASLN